MNQGHELFKKNVTHIIRDEKSRFNPEAAFPNLKYIKNKKEDNVYSNE